MPKEFAPGIPLERKKQKLPEVKTPVQWEFGVHRHDAQSAGEHYDLRLGDPSTGHAHSWAIRHFPKPGEVRLAVQQPTHTIPYMDFKGRIPLGTYGGGDVELAQRGKAEVLGADDTRVRFNVYKGRGQEEFILFRPKDEPDEWMIRNVTKTREALPDVPVGKSKYKSIKPENIDYEKPNTVLQAKLDGAHVLFNFDRPQSQVRTFSHRPVKATGEPIEHTHRIPDFRKHRAPTRMSGTVLRGELHARDSKGQAIPPARVGGILNASVWKSRDKQREEGELVPVAFDVVRWRGKDVQHEPYGKRLELLQEAVQKAPWLQLPRSASTPEEKKKLVEDIRTGKEPTTDEGVIEWDLNSSKPPTKAKFDKVKTSSPSHWAGEIRELESPEERRQAAALERRVFAPNSEYQNPKPKPKKSHTEYGAFDDGKLVGMVQVNKEPLKSWERDSEVEKLRKLKPEVWVSSLAVAPEQRGQGVAQALRNHLKGQYSSILTGTSSRSDPAMQHINAKQGFNTVLDRGKSKTWHWAGSVKEAGDTAVIVRGNPKYIENNPNADRFYGELKGLLQTKGYDVQFDEGKPYTSPPSASLWVGHSRGVDRLRWAPEGTKTVAVGSFVDGDASNHPKDKVVAGRSPNRFHYVLSKDMKKELGKRLDKTAAVGTEAGYLVEPIQVPAHLLDKVPQEEEDMRANRFGKRHHITLVRPEDQPLLKNMDGHRVTEQLRAVPKDDLEFGREKLVEGRNHLYRVREVDWPSMQSKRKELGLPPAWLHSTVGTRPLPGTTVRRAAGKIGAPWQSTTPSSGSTNTAPG